MDNDVTHVLMWSGRTFYLWFCCWQQVSSLLLFVVSLPQPDELSCTSSTSLYFSSWPHVRFSFSSSFFSCLPLWCLRALPESSPQHRWPTCCMATVLLNLPGPLQSLHQIMRFSQPDSLQSFSFSLYVVLLYHPGNRAVLMGDPQGVERKSCGKQQRQRGVNSPLRPEPLTLSHLMCLLHLSEHLCF